VDEVNDQFTLWGELFTFYPVLRWSDFRDCAIPAKGNQFIGVTLDDQFECADRLLPCVRSGQNVAHPKPRTVLAGGSSFHPFIGEPCWIASAFVWDFVLERPGLFVLLYDVYIASWVDFKSNICNKVWITLMVNNSDNLVVMSRH